MIFKFLQRPITIDFFISEKYYFAFKNFPIVHSSKFIPNWWKNTPKSSFNWDKFQPDLTTKSCVGIIETFKNGYILPLWSDLAIKIENPDENSWKLQYSFSDNISNLHLHSSEQLPNFYTNYCFLKITCPWLIKFNDNIKIILMDPFYLTSEPKPYITPYGILKNLNGFSQINPFMIFPTTNTELIIKSGTPLLHLIPITEKPLVIKTHMISDIEYNKINSLTTTRSSWFRTGINLMKKK